MQVLLNDCSPGDDACTPAVASDGPLDNDCQLHAGFEGVTSYSLLLLGDFLCPIPAVHGNAWYLMQQTVQR